MPSKGKQVENGKAFEYALAMQYVNYFNQKGIRTEFIEDSAYATTKRCFEGQEKEAQERFCLAALKTIDTIIKLEPGLTSPKDEDEILKVSLAADSEGQSGDIRDVIFTLSSSRWEIGFSAKNNHEAVKHSRLSRTSDFGLKWLGIPCSQTYWDEVRPLFNELQILRSKKNKWNEIEGKKSYAYVPVLKAFRKELLRINSENENIPQKLIKYLIGKYPFYKIIKDDTHNLVIVKAFNLEGQLNKTVNRNQSQYKTPKLNYPTRIVEFEMKEGSETTLNMILDEGWEISFRIHSADTIVENSLKFDIQLTGNPPILFSQYLFQ